MGFWLRSITSILLSFSIYGCKGLSFSNGISETHFSKAELVEIATPFGFYVSPQGNDSWDGRSAVANPSRNTGPVATLERARDLVRAKRALHEPAALPYVIYLMPGVHERGAPLYLGLEDSGTATSPTQIRSYPGAMAELRGSREIKNFVRYSGNIWVANLDPGLWPNPDFRSLFVNGERRTRARSPNRGVYAAQEAFEGGLSYLKGTFDPGIVEVGNTELVVYREWSQGRATISNVTASQINVYGHYPLNQAGGYLPYGFYLDNSFAALDAPGEWYLDKKQRRVFYVPLVGENPNSVRISAPVAETLVAIGSTTEPVHDLYLSDLVLSETDWHPANPDGQGFSQAAQNAGYGQSSIVIWNAKNIGVSHCTLKALGGAYAIEGWGDDLIFESNALRDLAGGGIRVGTPDGWGPTPKMASRNRVSRNNITNIGQIFKEAAAINGQLIASSQFTENYISGAPYTGISLGWNWSFDHTIARDNVIESNTVLNTMQELSDGGGIYVLGNQPNSRISGNLVKQVGNTEADGYPLFDFAGMYSLGFPNPATGAETCPVGYTTFKAYGSQGIDESLFYCARPHNPDLVTSLQFGGIYGNRPNPFTGENNCPTGYDVHQVYGGSHGNVVDHAIYLCSAAAKDGSPGPFLFGGFTGFIDHHMTTNPLFTNAPAWYCPKGYIDQQILDTAFVDWPLDMCFRQNWGHGIYLDEGAQGFTVSNNQIINAVTSSLMLHNARENLFENNLSISPVVGSIQLTQKAELPGYGNIFRKNIFYSSRRETKIWFFYGGLPDAELVGNSEGNLYYSIDPAYTNDQLKYLQNTFHADQQSLVADPLLRPLGGLGFTIDPASPAISMGFQMIDLSKLEQRR